MPTTRIIPHELDAAIDLDETRLLAAKITCMEGQVLDQVEKHDHGSFIKVQWKTDKHEYFVSVRVIHKR